MPLTDYEKLALSDFLNIMDTAVLNRVAAAITNGAIKPTLREEAFECVMLHTESLFQVLNLKRVSTAVLLKYLHHLRESISGTASKDEMLVRLYQKWNLPFPSPSIHVMSPPTVPTNNLQLYAPAPMPSNHYAPVPTPVNHYASALMPANSSHTQPNLHDHQFEMMIAASRMAGMNKDPLSQMVRSKEVLKEMNSMAFEEYIVGFAQAFYNLLNHPTDSHGFNNSHFFEDCKLKILIKAASEDSEIEGEGVTEVLQALLDLKRNHKLLFSPNLTEKGVRSKEDCHGLVSVAVCGTLHQTGGPVGVFEQCFILSADPFARQSYKILETVMILRSSTGKPSMMDLMITSGRRSEHKLALEAGSYSSESISNSAPILAIKD